MAKKDYQDIKDFDDIGVYVTVPLDSVEPQYNYRKIDDYCKKKGIQANELTDEELRQFEVKEQ